MNVVEKANEVSVFGRWAANVSQVTSPWEYSIRRNVPAFTTTITEDSQKTWTAGSTLSWTFPRLGLLRDMRFKVSIDLSAALTGPARASSATNRGFTLAAGPNAAAAPALGWAADGNQFTNAAELGRMKSIFLHPGGVMKLFTQYEIRARTREVARMYPENIYYHYMSQVYSYDKNFTHADAGQDNQTSVSDESSRITQTNILNGLHLQRLAALMPSNGVAFNLADGGQTGLTEILTFYLHVPFSYFQRMGNAFLTSFCEDLSISLQCASSLYKESLGPIGAYLGPGTVTITPQYSWIQPRPEEMAKLRQQMLASSLGIPRLQFSCLSEGDGVAPASVGGALSTFTMKLSCSYPVIRTLFWIQSDVNLDNLFVPHSANTMTVPITSVDVSGSGTTFLSMSESQVLEQMVLPPHNKVMGDRLIYALNWSLLDTNTEMGGYLPTRNLSNLTFTVKANCPTVFVDKGAAATPAVLTDAARTVDNYRLRVIHEYYVIEQTVPSNGQVNVSAFD